MLNLNFKGGQIMGKSRGVIFTIAIFLLFIYGCSTQEDHGN